MFEDDPSLVVFLLHFVFKETWMIIVGIMYPTEIGTYLLNIFVLKYTNHIILYIIGHQIFVEM